MRLLGRTALVTGGSRGIGRAVCLAYAAEGARVAVNFAGRREEAEDVVAAIAKQGGEAVALQADIADEHQIDAMFERIAARWGGVDILVNNAAIYPRKKWFDITADEWDRVMAVNLKSCFLTAKAAYPHMKAQGSGKIVNVSSVTFFKGQTEFLHYVSSKGGIIGFTRALAREVGTDGIQVNCITPGAVQTEQELQDIPSEDERRKLEAFMAEVQCTPGRLVPRDLAGSFVFLASADSDRITGQTLNVDGGWLMH